MHKKILIISLLLSSILTSLIAFNLLKSNIFLHNFQMGVLSQKVRIPEEYGNSDLTKNKIIAFKFVSNQNNLGIVEILFNNHLRINKDKIVFRIREYNKNTWYYESIYDSSLFDSGQFFPFGFPLINNSENKVYWIELESMSGSQFDYVSINSNSKYFNAKYLYSKDYLLSNKKELLHFTLSKSKEIASFITPFNYVKLIFIFLVSFILLNKICMHIVRQLKTADTSKLKVNANQYLPLSLIVVIHFLSHSFFIDYSQYWDSDWYWQLLLSAVNIVRNSDGSIFGLIETVINNFNFLGHPSMGYVLIVSIGQFINFGDVRLLNFENIIISEIAIISFYLLITKWRPKQNIQNLLITLIFAFNPLFYAATISFNLDFAVAVFTLLTITFLSYKKYIWFIIASMLLIFSKETGVLIFLSIFFLQFYLNKKEFIIRIYYFLFPILSFLIYLYFSHWNLWSPLATSNVGNRFLLTWNNEGIFTLGFNIENIKVRLFQMFIMNFNWLITPIILLNLKKLYKISNSKFVILLFCVFILFNLLYTVMPFSRYVVLSSVLMLILLSQLNKLSHAYLIILSVLMIIQTFKSIDPSPLIIFGSNRIGENLSSPIFGYRDGMVYNSEFTYIDSLSSLILNQKNKDAGIIIDAGSQYFFKNIKEVGTVEEIEKITKINSSLEYIYVPWFANRDNSLEKLGRYYRVEYKEKINYRGYYVEIYTLKK